LRLAPLIGQKEALVFPGKGAAHAVFQQARAPHDDRMVAELVERRRQSLGDLGRKAGVLEHLHQARIFLPHTLDLPVLAVVGVLEIVVMDEVQDRVRAHVPRPRNLYVPEQAVSLRRQRDDLGGQEHARALSAQFAVALGGMDNTLQ
jgi:hypothetical protein